MSLVRKWPPLNSYDQSREGTRSYEDICKETSTNLTYHQQDDNTAYALACDEIQLSTEGYDPKQGSKGRGLGVPAPQVAHHKP